jgi:hypothetical protein
MFPRGAHSAEGHVSHDNVWNELGFSVLKFAQQELVVSCDLKGFVEFSMDIE